MDKRRFRTWFETFANSTDRVRIVTSAMLEQIGTADAILFDAVQHQWDAQTMCDTLKKMGIDVGALESAIADSPLAPTVPPVDFKPIPVVVPAPAPAPKVVAPVKEEKKKKWWFWKKEEPAPEPESAPTPQVVLTPASRLPGMGGSGTTKPAPADDEDAVPAAKSPFLSLGGPKPRPASGNAFVKSSGKKAFGIGGLDRIGDGLQNHFRNGWQGYTFFLAVLVVLGVIIYMAPAQGTSSLQQSGTVSDLKSVNAIPVLIPLGIILALLSALEASSRYDLSDSIMVFAAITMSSIGKLYQESLIGSFTDNNGVTWGTGIYWILILGPYLILLVSTLSNRTENPYSVRFLSRFDFSATYNTLLAFWAMSKLTELWSFIPNPCIFPSEIYFGLGLLFLIFELSGNGLNLLVASVVGVLAGAFMFSSRIWVVPTVYALMLVYTFLVKGVIKEINVVAPPKSRGAPGSDGVLSGVERKFLLPYDMFAGAVWVTMIVVVLWHGNLAIPFGL